MKRQTNRKTQDAKSTPELPLKAAAQNEVKSTFEDNELTMNSSRESKNPSGIGNSLTGKYGTIIQIKPKPELICFIREKKKGKSPPGKARSPGSIPGLYKDCKVAFFKENRPDCKDESYQINQNKYSNFYHNLIITIMKKQIFLLVMALLALNLPNAFGQVLCPAPRAVDVTCLKNDAIHPMPGTAYDYAINVPTPTGTKAYTWFVTQDKNFIVAPGTLTTDRETTAGSFLAATGTGYNDPATGGSTLSLTWKSFVYDAAKPVFVVIQVRSTVTGDCTPNNLKVFKIEPINAFTLDIANVGSDKTTVSAYEASINRCISDIVSAAFDATAPEGVKYDFGVDYLYYVVTAANFSTSWRPSLQLAGLDAKETVTAVEWFRPTDTGFATPEAMPLAAGTYTATNPVLALDASGTVGVNGECIVIRVTVDHTNGTNQYEGIADETITAAVDGKTQLALASPLGDIHHSSTVPVGNTDCGKEDGFKYDTAIQVLKARPDIQSAAPATTPLLPVK